jgi:hypothetical protein
VSRIRMLEMRIAQAVAIFKEINHGE